MERMGYRSAIYQVCDPGHVTKQLWAHFLICRMELMGPILQTYCEDK